MAKSKNTISNEMYGEDFEYLSPAQKASVTKKFNAQKLKTIKASRQRATVTPARVVGKTAKIGRVGYNGVKECILQINATVRDLITQSGFAFAEDKESVSSSTTGSVVSLSDQAVDGETYVITTQIKSA